VRVQSFWHENVVVIEPPLPLGAADVAPSVFLEAHGLDPTIPTVLLVSRMESTKLEVIETAIEAVADDGGSINDADTWHQSDVWYRLAETNGYSPAIYLECPAVPACG
jgi:Mrp family chromosome partitioning ATPase